MKNQEAIGKTRSRVIDFTEKLEESMIFGRASSKREGTTVTALKKPSDKNINKSTSIGQMLEIEKEVERMCTEKLKQEPEIEISSRKFDEGETSRMSPTAEAVHPARGVATTGKLESVDHEVLGILEMTFNVSQKLARVKSGLSREAWPAGSEKWVGAKEQISELEQMLDKQAKKISNFRNLTAAREVAEISEVAVQVGNGIAHHMSRMLPTNRRTVISTAPIISIGVITPEKGVQHDILPAMTPKILEISKLSDKLQRALKGKLKVAKRATNMIINLENDKVRLAEEIKDLKRRGFGVSKSDR